MMQGEQHQSHNISIMKCVYKSGWSRYNRDVFIFLSAAAETYQMRWSEINLLEP